MFSKHLRVAGFISLGLAPLAAGCDVPPGDEAPQAEGSAVEAVAQPVIIADTHVGSGEPGGAWFQGVKYISYTDGNGRVNLMRDNGSGWTRQLLTEKAPAGSTLYAWNGFMYLVWVGTDGAINTMRTSDGVNWADKRTFTWGDSGLPAVAAFEDTLQIVVKYGQVPEFWSSRDGVNWGYGGALDDVKSSSSFGLTSYNSSLVLAWKDGSGRVAVRSYSSSAGWNASTVTDVWGNPSLSTVPTIRRRDGSFQLGQLAMAVREPGFGGADGPLSLWRSFDTFTFTKDDVSVKKTTEKKPVIVSSGFNSTMTATDTMWNDVVWFDTNGWVNWNRF